ncbi:VOC family protein [Altererythrobacter sp. H2]|uniref:VOC family protein n=1 Tax=Altererythrobacter sp. H2 TaxID=3108391 RepID=UPI000BCE579D|nr:VOC family protein [Altererythrobacter sp. H2]OZA93592.1 MAG: glyoxalase [Erythrobacter sp. 34-65-8]WRK96947.1 VOC family protein [Altererythrobacter sp. H2]
MFNHIMIGCTDIEKSKDFYAKVLGVLGCPEPMRNEDAEGNVRYFFIHDGSVFALTQPIDGNPATCANGSTIGFRCGSGEKVKELHDVAVANGATSIEGAPGVRNGSMGPMHLSYFRDLDGHKICGIHQGA